MPRFDRSLRYQFGCFFADGESLSPDRAQELPRLISAPADGEPSLGLSLRGRADREQALLVMGTGAPVATTGLSWSSGVWRLTWNPVRLDLHVDARGYMDISGQQLTLSSVRRRVAGNLAAAARQLELPIARLVVVLVGESMCEGGPTPAQVVTQHFYSDAIVGETAAGNILDVVARLNHRSVWRRPGGIAGCEEIPLNRIETAQAVWEMGEPPSTFLQWQFDFNTGPELMRTARFSPDEIHAFFEEGESWIAERVQAAEMNV